MNKTTSLLFEQKRNSLRRPFSVMVKSAGSVCNLDCDYCYYIDKCCLYSKSLPSLSMFTMKDEVLEKLIADFIASQPLDTVEFVWHGGEPTLLGVNYFEKILKLQNKYANGKRVFNVMQTNGTLIDDRWAEFLSENNFFCGLSIDGPQHLHDNHRRDKNGNGSWEKTVECACLFKKHGVEFNTMSVVNATNAKYPLEVYGFLKELGSHYMQFSPIVERIAVDNEDVMKIVDVDYDKAAATMSANVSAEDWGNFLCAIFDSWVKSDVGSYFVNWFDNTLASYVGQKPALCSMAEYCCCSPAVEFNGDVYCCDHFVFDNFKVGNIFEHDIAELVKSDKQLFFEERKKTTLSSICKSCDFLSLCGGDCLKNRIDITSQGEKISSLCQGFKMYFKHTQKHFKYMADEIFENRAPANVMSANFNG